MLTAVAASASIFSTTDLSVVATVPVTFTFTVVKLA